MSELEDEFEMHLKAYNMPYERQFKDKRIRGVRNVLPFDFAVGNSILVEINGGTWIKSGHTTGKGLQRDYSKHNQAVLLGYKVLLFTSEDVRSGRAIETIKEATRLP